MRPRLLSVIVNFANTSTSTYRDARGITTWDTVPNSVSEIGE